MLETIPLPKLHDDPRSANRMAEERFVKLVANIQETGQMQPLIVRPHPKKKGHFIIIDGHFRRQAIEQLGKAETPCLVWDISEQEAALLLASLNRLRGEDHPGKRAELLHELQLDFGHERLCQLIPESQVELAELLALMEQQETDYKELLDRQVAAEATSLPVILNFVLSQEDAKKVQAVLDRFCAEDGNIALLQVCQWVGDHE